MSITGLGTPSCRHPHPIRLVYRSATGINPVGRLRDVKVVAHEHRMPSYGRTKKPPSFKVSPTRSTVIGISTSTLFGPSFAHNVRTENPYIITSFANPDNAHIGTYGARPESFRCPVQKRGVIIGLDNCRYRAGRSRAAGNLGEGAL